MCECFIQTCNINCACCVNNCTQHNQVSQLGAAEVVCCNFVCGNSVYLNAILYSANGAKVSIHNQSAAFLYNAYKFIQRRLVQCYDTVCILCNNGRTNIFVGNDYVYVCSTATHFGTIGRTPGNFFAFQHASISHNFTHQQRALAAETCDDRRKCTHNYLPSSTVISLYTPRG